MLSREEQVRQDLAVREADRRRAYAMTAPMLEEYGRFIASLAPWTHFVTLTHDPRRLEKGHTIVGHQRHRKQVKRWVFDEVRVMDPSARWWSEEESHKSGQRHEHGLLAANPRAPVLSMRQAWFDRCGYAVVLPIDQAKEDVCEYVAKYTGKAATVEPMLMGFGLLPVASFARASLAIASAAM